MWDVSIYIQTDSMCPKELKRCYGYLIECTTKKGKLHRREETGEMKGTLHKTTLTAINEAMKRLNQSCTVHIYMKDGFICNMFVSNIDKWAANDWQTSKNNEVENREEWEELWKLTRGQLVRMIPGKHKYSNWLITKMKAEKQEIPQERKTGKI